MHKSVLLEECIHYLNVKESSIIIDCTLGYAGHSSEILRKIKKGFLFAFDQDFEAVQASKEKLHTIADNYAIIETNFEHLKEELQKRDVQEVDGILFDLGVSSPQLDEDYRGFSFHKDANLDMRMDNQNPVTASTVVNTYEEKELIRIFRAYGEEKYAASIARKIVERRKSKKIETTLELVEIIKTGVPFKYQREHHPARKVFQAIRIEVNRELEVFEKALLDALDMISVGGRICVITFHSLEDRICKKIFQKCTSIPNELSHLPILPEEYEPKYRLICNVTPTKKELEDNKRSRSARLRVIERIKR